MASEKELVDALLAVFIEAEQHHRTRPSFRVSISPEFADKITKARELLCSRSEVSSKPPK